MKKTLKRVTTLCLALAMVVSSMNFGFVVKAADVEKYTIYPTPQKIEYGTSKTTLSDAVNVVYEDNIDEFTKQHVVDVFGTLGITVYATSEKDPSKTNILIGINGQDGLANDYFKENNLIKNFDFNKYDASILSIKDNTIAILAKDTDAAFHAITSLKHIFTQVKNKEVTDLTIRDYADVKSRGFIEGYYGNPWSNEDRADLMRFGGDYKLNNYIYAPKDDPKHNAKWRELYTPEELTEISKLAQAGNESKCYYVYALHTFMNSPIRFDSHYQEDLKIIQDKFEQLMGAGVKQFAILADDAGVPGGNAQNYVRLMNDMTAWMQEKAKTVPGLKTDLIFCPNDYMGMGNSRQMQTLKQLPESVSIIQTGGKVWGEVGPNFNDTFYNNMGRPAYMWINWPCSDNTKDSLIMGGAEKVLKPNVNPDTVNGIVLNPMQQSEPSKQGLFTNADYAWNIWETEDKYNSVWHDSFNYIDHGNIYDTTGSSAYRELSKHMMNSAKLYNEESFEIKDQLDAFIKDLNQGKSIVAQAAELRVEFVKLQQAAKDYRAHTGNTRTLEQIIYWIDCWDDTTAAIINFLDCAVALENEDSSLAVQTYLAGQEYAEKSRTHTFHYVDHLEKAVVGRLHITPFMGKLDQALSTKVGTIIDPTKQIVNFITNREDAPDGSLNNVFDNNPSTEIIFKTPSNIQKDTYVGVMYQLPIDVNKVIFRMGQAQNPADNFTKAVLEYTTDGTTWKPVNDKTYNSAAVIEEGNLNLKGVLGVRLRATEYVDNKWLGVRDIVINPDEAPGQVENNTTISTNKLSVKANSLDKITDGDMNTYVHLAEDPYKAPGAQYEDYIPVDASITLMFDEYRTLTSIHFKQDSGTDSVSKYNLQYTQDGENWIDVQIGVRGSEINYEFAKPTRALGIRVVNTELKLQNDNRRGYWWKVYDFSFTEEENSSLPVTKEHNYTNASFDFGSTYTESRAELVLIGSVILHKDEYFGLDLSRIKDLESVDAVITKSDRIDLEISKNGIDWTVINDIKEIGKYDARYIRFINKTNEGGTIFVDQFIVHTNEIAGPSLLDSNIGINNSWGVKEDSRNNGAAFDGNVDTTTEFADLPRQGQYIIYDLGQMRTISSLEMFCQDSAVNYIRDAKVEISADQKEWNEVFTIGDGVENVGDGGVTCIDSNAGYKASNRYPNKVSIRGEIEPTQARYIKITMTAKNDNRAVLFNEIEINNGEYVPVINDPTFKTTGIEKQGHTPQLMFDQDLTTSYMPASKDKGSITYTLSENLQVNTMNILQKANSNATVEIYAEKDGKRSWIPLGTLTESFNTFTFDVDYLLEVRLSWENGKNVNVSEMVIFNDPELSFTEKLDLEKEINKLPKFEQKDYSEATWTAYQEALTQANAIMSDPKAKKSEINGAIKQLQDTKAALEPAYALPTSMNATLTDIISMNIYLDVNEETKENVTVTFHMNGQKDINVALKDKKAESNGLYKLSVPICARQMNDEVTMTIQSPNTTFTETYTIVAYAESLLAKQDLDELLRPVVENMLNYGAASQVYFKYNTENLANKNIDNQNYKTVKASDLQQFEKNIGEPIKGITYGASNLRLLSETTIRHHFIIDPAMKDQLKFILRGTNELTYLEPVFYDDNKAYIDVPFITVDKMMLPSYIYVSTNEETTYVDYSVFSYAKEILEKEDASEEIKDLVRAMVAYGITANAYSLR